MMTVRSKLNFRYLVTLAALATLSGGAFSADADERAELAENVRIDLSAEQRVVLDETISEQAARTIEALNAEWLADVEFRLNRPDGVPVAAN